MQRERYESARDIEGVPGFVVEVKSRKRLPRLVVDALEQATRYRVLEETPVVTMFERGSRRGIACVWLDDFARMVRKPAPPSGLPVCTCSCCADERARGVRP